MLESLVGSFRKFQQARTVSRYATVRHRDHRVQRAAGGMLVHMRDVQQAPLRIWFGYAEGRCVEGLISGYIDWAKEAVESAAERILEDVTGRSIEWLTDQIIGIAGAGNDILIGDDVALLLGLHAANDDENDFGKAA